MAFLPWLIICLVVLLGQIAVGALASDPEPLSQDDATKGGAVKLTRPDGTPIYVNPRAIAFIRGPLPGEEGHTTIVFTSGAKQTVLESVQDIMDIWEAERLPPPETPP